MAPFSAAFFKAPRRKQNRGWEESVRDALLDDALPGLRVTYSNRLEALADRLAAAIGSRRQTSPLAKVQVVVPHRDVETWLQQRLACRLGVAANVEFMSFRRFLRRLADAALVTEDGGAPRKLQVVDQALLMEHLLGLFFRPSAPEALEREGIPELADYLRGKGDSAAADASSNSRRTQLARRLARLCCAYDESTDYLVRWTRGEPVGFEGASARAAERWQGALWRLIREELRRHDSLCVPLCELPAREGFQLRLPLDTFIFGIGELPLSALRLVQVLLTLEDGRPLSILAFNPCREQWDDIKDLGKLDAAGFEALRGAWKASESLLSAGDDDLFLLEGLPEHPLLMAMGRPGRERIRVLNELTGYNFGESFVAASDSGSQGQDGRGTLLARIQDDVLDNAVDLPALELSPKDRSVRLLSCTGIQRECEAVAERAARVLRDDPSAKFGDISILVAADQADAYFSRLVPALSALGIPACLRELPPERHSRLPEAARRLLGLPLRGFTRTSVMEVLTHPCVMANVPGASREALALLVDRLGIFQGLDRLGEDGRGEGYLDTGDGLAPLDLYNWDQGLTRLALGMAMRSALDGDAAPFVRPRPPRREVLGGGAVQDGEVLDRYWPVPPPMEMSEDAPRWLLLAQSILADARFAAAGDLSEGEAPGNQGGAGGRSGWRTMGAWARFIAQMLDTYLAAEDSFEGSQKEELLRTARDLRHVSLRDLRGSAEGREPEEVPVPYSVAHALFTERLDAMRAQVGSYLLDGVNVARLTRALPAKHLFIVGASAGAFPPVQKRDRLDLMGERLSGDWAERRRSQGITRFRVTPRDRSRYLFLQAVLGARETLTVSWQGRDQSNGLPLDPSSAAADLQRLLQLYGVELKSVSRTVAPRRSDLAAFGGLRAIVEGRPIGAEDGVNERGKTSAVWSAGGAGHSPEAMKEAAALALREILRKAAPEAMDEAISEGSLLTRRGTKALLARLPDQVRSAAEEVCRQLELCGGGEAAAAPVGGAEELDHKVSVSLLSKFLENPAQASASALLRLRQDDEDATEDALLTRDDEVFSFDDALEQSVFLNDRMAELLCGSGEFLKDEWMQGYFGLLQKRNMTSGKGAQEKEKKRRLDAEIAEMSGEFKRRRDELLRRSCADQLGIKVSGGIFPAGAYGSPLMEKFSGIFQDWLESFAKAGLHGRDLVFYKVGFNTDEMESAIVRQFVNDELGRVEMNIGEGRCRRLVRLKGVTGIVGASAQDPGTLVSLQFKAGKPEKEHLIRAFVHGLAVLVSGQMPAHEGPYCLDCFTFNKEGEYKNTQFSGITIENARKYLLRLAEAMLSSPNNYWMPGAEVVGGLSLTQKRTNGEYQSMLERLKKSERKNSFGGLRSDELEALRLPNSDEMQAAFGDVNEPDADKTGRWGFFCAHRVIEKDKDKQKWDNILEYLQLDVGED